MASRNELRTALLSMKLPNARQIGWHQLKNGELIEQCEQSGYDILLSTDKNMRYQQNFTGRLLAIVILGNQQWPDVRPHLDRIATAVNAATPGSYTEVEIPRRS